VFKSWSLNPFLEIASTSDPSTSQSQGQEYYNHEGFVEANTTASASSDVEGESWYGFLQTLSLLFDWATYKAFIVRFFPSFLLRFILWVIHSKTFLILIILPSARGFGHLTLVGYAGAFASSYLFISAVHYILSCVKVCFQKIADIARWVLELVVYLKEWIYCGLNFLPGTINDKCRLSTPNYPRSSDPSHDELIEQDPRMKGLPRPPSTKAWLSREHLNLLLAFRLPKSIRVSKVSQTTEEHEDQEVSPTYWLDYRTWPR